MDINEIIEKTNHFLIEEIEVDPELISPTADLREDLGIDSLDFVDIVVLVERNFGFKIKAEEMTEVRTLEAFYQYIGKKLNTK
ncbi:MAG: phosphopantetheine-binding protein [Bacteroidales bacterium]|nr:phosphopantetheine-binding protein [Bacteroidales bacterium]